MNTTGCENLTVTPEELTVLASLLESERTELLVEIRHTDNRVFRDGLRRRLALVEALAARCHVPGAEPAPSA
jgi:hypothetical protein